MIKEAKTKFLANFKVDRNNKVVRHRATDPASLRPAPDIPNVSNTNELQSLKNYVDEQREQMQNIIGDMQNDYRRLARAFDKSSIANFPSHEVELGGNTRNTSAIGCHDQPLYGMLMDTYPEQQQIGSKSADLHMSGPSARDRELSRPATAGPIFNELPRHAPEPPHMAQILYPEQPQIGSKTVDLHMSGPSARERVPSRPTTVGRIFNELPRYAPEPPHTTQNLNYPVGPSAYNDGRSAHNHGRSGPMTGQSAHERSAHNHGRSGPMTGQSAHDLFEEDCYLNPHPSQQHFPSH